MTRSIHRAPKNETYTTIIMVSLEFLKWFPLPPFQSYFFHTLNSIELYFQKVVTLIYFSLCGCQFLFYALEVSNLTMIGLLLGCGLK